MITETETGFWDADAPDEPTENTVQVILVSSAGAVKSVGIVKGMSIRCLSEHLQRSEVFNEAQAPQSARQYALFDKTSETTSVYLTQTLLSEALGVSQARVSQVLRKQGSPADFGDYTVTTELK